MLASPSTGRSIANLGAMRIHPQRADVGWRAMAASGAARDVDAMRTLLKSPPWSEISTFRMPGAGASPSRSRTRWSGRRPNLCRLDVAGAAAWVHAPAEQGVGVVVTRLVEVEIVDDGVTGSARRSTRRAPRVSAPMSTLESGTRGDEFKVPPGSRPGARRASPCTWSPRTSLRARGAPVRGAAPGDARAVRGDLGAGPNEFLSTKACVDVDARGVGGRARATRSLASISSVTKGALLVLPGRPPGTSEAPWENFVALPPPASGSADARHDFKWVSSSMRVAPGRLLGAFDASGSGRRSLDATASSWRSP